jgi:hypothetical protein
MLPRVMFSILMCFSLVVFECSAIADDVRVSHKERAVGTVVSEKAPVAQQAWNLPSVGPFTT